MTGRLREELRTMQDCSALRIFGGEHQPLHPCQTDRSGAHRARLKRDAERCSVQPLIAELRRSRAQDQLLGVRRRVLPLDDAIAVGSQDRAVARQQHGAHRHFATPASGLGFRKRECYGFIVIHAGPEEFEKD